MTNLQIYLFAHGPSDASAKVIWAHALASQRLRVHTGEPHDRPCPAAALMRSADLARREAHLGLGDAAVSEHEIGLPVHVGAGEAKLRPYGFGGGRA